jgi:hypothetical protein
MKKVIDLTGKKFGMLTVINMSKKTNSYNQTYWDCSCDCNPDVTKSIRGDSLRNGYSTSCGCVGGQEKNIINMIGQRFGRLVVIEKAEKLKNSKNTYAHWSCQCDCGNIKVVSGNSLRNGSSISCGCLREERKLPKGISAFHSIYNVYKSNAKNRNLTFDLEYMIFEKLINQNCFYCGSAPCQIKKNKGGNGGYIYNGIDRIDSSKGYTEDNVVTCCGECNKRKSDSPQREFYSWVDRVHTHSHRNDSIPVNISQMFSAY